MVQTEGFVSEMQFDTGSIIACCSVHLKVEEKITLEANRDGGLEHMEVRGTMWLIIRFVDVTSSLDMISYCRDPQQA